MTGIGWLDSLLAGIGGAFAVFGEYVWSHKAGVVALGSLVISALAFWRAGLPKSARWLLEEVPPAPDASPPAFSCWGVRNLGEHAASRVRLTATRLHATNRKDEFRKARYTYFVEGQVGPGQLGVLGESEAMELRGLVMWFEDEQCYGYPPVWMPETAETARMWERRASVRWRGVRWPWRRQVIDLY